MPDLIMATVELIPRNIIDPGFVQMEFVKDSEALSKPDAAVDLKLSGN